MGGFRGGAKGGGGRGVSVTGKCPGHRSLNFLDPQDIYLEISMAGKFKYNPLLFFQCQLHAFTEYEYVNLIS